MRRYFREFWATKLVLVFAGLPGLAAADIDVGGQITVASDYMFRGVSQTMSGATLQAELDIEHVSGWYGYAWASNVDFTDSATPDDGARTEINIGLGYEFSITDNVVLGLEGVAYIFPETHAGYDYDYEELLGCVTVNDRHGLTIGYSNNVFGDGAKGIFYAVGSELDLSEQLSLGLELGHYDLSDAYDMTYSYAELSLAGELKTLKWRISYFTTTDEAEEIFYKSTIDDQLVLTLSMPF